MRRAVRKGGPDALSGIDPFEPLSDLALIPPQAGTPAMARLVELVGLLRGRGLLPLFDHWSFSDEVGVYKPDPAIFRHALSGLGDPAPDRVAHIGDRIRTDVAGARGMGMIAVRYTGVYNDDDEGPEAHHVVEHHADIARTLSLG